MSGLSDQSPFNTQALTEVAESTGVPAEAIEQYVALNLVTPIHGLGKEKSFSPTDREAIVILRIIELLGFPPQAMRPTSLTNPLLIGQAEALSLMKSQNIEDPALRAEILRLIAQLSIRDR